MIDNAPHNAGNHIDNVIYPCLANIPTLYDLKTLENQRFSRVFKGYKMVAFARNELNYLKNDLRNYLYGF